MSTSRTREKADGELFKSTGIDDNATSTKVTVSNTGVEVTGDITLTSAGSIKTQGTDILLGTADTGIRFYDQTSSIYPVNVTSSSDRDNAVDLGHPSVRFKDAYLSGGVYLGGTGAANKLDDYEEGTWTPTAAMLGSSWTAYSATYTKIGRVVHVQLYIDGIASNGSSANARIGGLPFTLISEGWAVGSMNISTQNADKSNFHTRMLPNSTNVDLKHGRDTTLIASDIDASHIIFSLTYFTS